MSLNPTQVEKAVKALWAYLRTRNDANSAQLFEDDSFVSLTLSLKKVPEAGRVKPFRIPLEHSLYEDKSICLLTKDPHKQFKEHLEQNPVDGIDKVIGLTKLRKNYRQYEDKRKLLQSFDLFLADDRILHALPSVLGKKFFDKKRQPSPVNLARNMNRDLAAARDSTYFFLSAGPTCMVKIARTSMTWQQAAANIMGSINTVVDKIPKKWKNIQAIYIRTHDSAALPIYNALPTQPVDNAVDISMGDESSKKRPLEDLETAIKTYKHDNNVQKKRKVSSKKLERKAARAKALGAASAAATPAQSKKAGSKRTKKSATKKKASSQK
mmetsp:Transcript_15396/g.30277  ORF Transcript_15396/g.30277 Transcript_15396/m.30277 type:complete len:325 (-) Transcript_15396:413-1387(-)|eukprot:CAMPEP_0175152712 /NCGR_PEP_ID=MMETSP0087-20121206/19282_1 /TAXON_ID=136419 /ORGANISM="Unknown Unknown, Strain D1" /LENGTH=324 /DNA_ID=CAMNT_0016439207 /DNA_START=110 /DNA_END=1084 /DNA_ORIENTATION=+